MIKNRKLVIISLLIMAIMLFIPNKSKASLQANKGGKSLTSVTADNFFIGIRRMETAYGTLGKNAVLDDKNLDTTHNGVDVHMALNTEWGTVALLTDSVYGVGMKSTDTTTGNASGVYDLMYKEYELTSTIYNGKTNSYNNKIGKSDERYFNNYTDSNARKFGDALDCMGWSNNYYSSLSETDPICARGVRGLFSCSDVNGNVYDYISGSAYHFTSRAVVVCGENL